MLMMKRWDHLILKQMNGMESCYYNSVYIYALLFLSRDQSRVSPSARALFIWSWSYASNYCLLAFDYFWTYDLVPWLYPLGALTKASLFHLALTFPERRWPMGTPAQGVTLFALYGILHPAIKRRA